MILNKVIGKCIECNGDVVMEYRKRPKTLEEGAIIGGAFLHPTPTEKAISENIKNLNTISYVICICKDCRVIYDCKHFLQR